MHPVLLIPLFGGALSALVAGAAIAVDPRHPANRRVAVVMGLCSTWALLEVYWNTLDDPEEVVRWVRLSSLCWVPLGALCASIFASLAGEPLRLLKRLLPWMVLAAVVGIVVDVSTPFGIASTERTAWGWTYRFGPAFPFIYGPTAAAVVFSCALLWRRAYPKTASVIERRRGRLALAAISVPFVAASLTDVVGPLVGWHVPGLGSASMASLGVAMAWSLRRYGETALLPSAHSGEILGALREGIALVRNDGRIRQANAGLERLVGVSRGRLVGRRMVDLAPEAEAAAREGDERECELARADGETIPVSVSAAPLRAGGGSVGVVFVVRDLREVASLRARLVMSGRLAAVGELAAGIAHEINNPMAYVTSNLNYLEGLLSDLPKRLDRALDPESTREISEGADLLAESLEGLERVAQIVRNVQGFSHHGSDRHELADLNAALESALRLAMPERNPDVLVQTHYRPLPLVPCNVQHMKQVFLNVILNAFHALGGCGTLELSSRLLTDQIEIAIHDDGCGMTPEVAERIFDPFFTTRPVGEGTGLGLSICFRIVQDHRGEVRVETRPGEGTTFRILLPLGEATP